MAKIVLVEKLSNHFVNFDIKLVVFFINFNIRFAFLKEQLTINLLCFKASKK